jgi:CheY-like chemotaxis protein
MSRSSVKIFVVDDSSFCRHLYKQHLSNLGFTQIFEFESGIECINEIGIQPDIILLDFDMTPINGTEVIAMLKDIYPSIKFILISSNQDPKLVDDVIAQGAFAFIAKGDNELDLITNN